MKRIKLLKTDLEKAQTIYSVFMDCAMFTVIREGHLYPVYDFSSNDIRSTLNSLRKLFPGDPVRFHRRFADELRSAIFSPFHLDCEFCYVYF